MSKKEEKTHRGVTDANGTTYIVCNKTNKITSYSNKHGVIYDADGKKIGKL